MASLLQLLLSCLENINNGIQSTNTVKMHAQKDSKDEKYNVTKLCHSSRQLWCTWVPWERCLRHAGKIDSIKKEETTPPGTSPRCTFFLCPIRNSFILSVQISMCPKCI